MSRQCQSRDLGQDGKPCQEIGVKIGRATHTSTARASPSRSPPVMAGLSPATMLCLPVGNLDRPLKEVNSRPLHVHKNFLSRSVTEGEKSWPVNADC